MKAQIKDLLLQALETELGGIHVYRTALQCVARDDLRKEWQEYLQQTEEHVEVVRGLLDVMDVNESEQTPGRAIVKSLGASLVEAMKTALAGGDQKAAQLVAAECVVLAETKDHANWALIGELGKHTKGEEGTALREAHEEVEDEEDEHLYHTTGWARELWIESLGMPAVLPPPEEEKKVKTAIGASRAKQSREDML